jgi:hypothetical protein
MHVHTMYRDPTNDYGQKVGEMKPRLAAAFLVLAGTSVFAHRLDEYLQGTIISVEKSRLQAQMLLTPGIIVFPFLISQIDTDANGIISETEQRAYAGRVLQDLSITIDGHRLTTQLLWMQFATIDELREGRGEIQLEFEANLPRGGRNRKLRIENHHQGRIAAYQVNCLIPGDPHIWIGAPNRNYSQSVYEWTTKRQTLLKSGFSLAYGQVPPYGQA